MESSTEFLENEKEKIFNIGIENLESIENLKKFLNFLEQVENATLENIILQLKELNETQNMSENMFDIFKTICQNLYKNN